MHVSRCCYLYRGGKGNRDTTHGPFVKNLKQRPEVWTASQCPLHQALRARKREEGREGGREERGRKDGKRRREKEGKASD